MYKYLAMGGACLAIIVGSYIYGRFDERKILTAKYDIATQEAVQRAVEKERKLQEKFNEALQAKLNDEYIIRERLTSDLNKLHNRESRRTRDKNQCACKNATGAELSREDAGFLVREAARADRFRAAYKQCYSILESIAKQ